MIQSCSSAKSAGVRACRASGSNTQFSHSMLAPLVLEEAAQHVAQHFHIAREARVGEQLQLVGQFVSKTLVGGMLGLELLHDGAQGEPWGARRRSRGNRMSSSSCRCGLKP